MSLKIAIQLYSVRNEMNRDPENALSEVKKAGYDGVELAGTFGKTPEQVKELLKKYDLVPVSAHVSLKEFVESVEDTVAKYRAIGCKYIVIPYLPAELRPGKPEFFTTVDKIAEIARKTKEMGLPLGYHNHDFEFLKLDDGQYAIDYMLSKVPSDELFSEPDVCWIDVSGVSPIDFIKKYSGRTPLVHLKDHNGARGSASYNLIGLKEERHESEFDYRALGDGVVDIAGTVKAGVENGADWFIVEYDLPPKNTTGEFEAGYKSCAYLRKLGF